MSVFVFGRSARVVRIRCNKIVIYKLRHTTQVTISMIYFYMIGFYVKTVKQNDDKLMVRLSIRIKCTNIIYKII